MRHLRQFCGLIILLAALTACAGSSATVAMHFEKKDGTKTPAIHAELATTPAAHSLGLMYRKSLDNDHAMLFIFPAEEERSFWMKNTYVELDIIFLDAAYKIVSIVSRAIPLTQTSRKSGKPAKYVLEVTGGSAQEWSITEGDRLVLEDSIPGTK